MEHMVCCICCQERPCVISFLQPQHVMCIPTAAGFVVKPSAGRASSAPTWLLLLLLVRRSDVGCLQLQFALMSAAWLHSQGISETPLCAGAALRCEERLEWHPPPGQ